MGNVILTKIAIRRDGKSLNQIWCISIRYHGNIETDQSKKTQR